MPSDPSKPLLRLESRDPSERPVGPPRAIPKPKAFLKNRQIEHLGPQFNRLAEVLARDPSGLTLRADPATYRRL